MTSLFDAARPDEADVSAAVAAAPQVKDYLLNHPGHDTVRLVVDDEHRESLTVPRSAIESLARILDHMAKGEGVALVPSHTELTTQQAADMLNVSRPFLIGLLDTEEIEYRRVGKHRRIKAESLLAYKRKDDLRRREVANDLTGMSQEMGTF
ncbi:helix-turn-helix domain-containing protein [Modestobacter lapidis]|nr:helix-turn-helix domain-containing protein [Modestobacter lapidis]